MTENPFYTQELTTSGIEIMVIETVSEKMRVPRVRAANNDHNA